MQAVASRILVEPTQDLQLVQRIITDPRIYSHVSDDCSPKPEDYQPPAGAVYLLVQDGDELLGCFIFHPHTVTVWEVHTCLLPNAWGDRAKESAALAAQWVWQTLPCTRLITNVPDCNRLAYRFALEAGMEPFGTNPDAYLKNGKLYAMHMLGLTRPGIESLRG